MDIPRPADTAAGVYLMRAEVIALRTVSSAGGAQSYISCYQITVAGGIASVAATPAGVQFPGALKASDPGILINIHAKTEKRVDPGPDMVPGGTMKQAGSGCDGRAKTCSQR
ncbi:Uu.00g068170.m01.CDS01 [Anthostomella pinea]|uniref:lytic cellulose monooxygenase (C4-dehydrogenating) n=1 Tax=Anthostomella pinea TaxID=933095 RepID=A0AAI8YL16_9PEZI|nr:Uu.00g068170.m01.CDS01 [Anthostomella pinea]